MAKLFKDNVIKEKLLNFEIPSFDEKIKIINNWLKLYKDWILLSKKEEELEWPFWDDFFGKVLGYESLTENEIYSRKFQPKVPEWWQKADIWLGIFGEDENLMKVIVELKDAKTSLDKPQQRAWNLTPVQQAFKYKPYFKECDFIIVSNFYETRLYIDSYYDYESFTLENLANPNNDYFEFRKFYFLLTKNNLISKSQESKTKSLLSTIRTQEKEITKKFYKEYSDLRMELLRDLRDNNSINGRISKEKLNLIFEKAQKIIDRIVFIHFCEDINDLLPNGKLKENLLRAEEIWFTPWDVLKIFFKWVDKWSEKLWIPDWYNWWLFAEDKDLDNLKVWDEICKKFIDLWEYDFANDLSVNILGHIFEQSISDMEEIKNKINIDWENSIVSKRKKDGIFYTPEYIVDYIVKNSVGKKIDEWEEELKIKHNLSEDITDKNYTKRAIIVYSELQEQVQNIKVLDPACWSWAFLVKVFDFLLDKNKEIAKKLEELSWTVNMQNEDYLKWILQNNIYWVDLNEESVEITKLSLWLKTAQKGKKLTNLDNNIKCWNSLIDDETIAWNKAFKWEEEFKEIMNNWGFDVIVGNPPYVLSRNNIFSWENKYFQENYNLIYEKANLYILFMEKSHKLIKKWWRLWFIVPNSWLWVDSWEKIRKFYLENTNLEKFINLKWESFPWVNVETVIFIYNKNSVNTTNYVKYLTINSWIIEEYLFKEIKQLEWKNNRNYIFDLLSSSDDNKIIDKIFENSFLLKEYYNAKVWLQAYEKWKWEPKQTAKDVENHVFDFTYNFDENTHKYLNWWDISRYWYNWSWNWLRYWKFLSQPKTIDLFSNERILIREITSPFPKVLNAVFIWNEVLLNNKSILNILWKDKNYSLKYLLILLNSSLIWFFHQRKSVKWNRTLFPKVVVNDLQNYPIKNISFSEQLPFIEKADFMLEKNKELQEKINKFLNRLKSSFWIEKLSWKLENFYSLDFGDFVKELSKNKINLSLKDQDEWEDYFVSYKKEILDLKIEIDNCDKEIDEMVFDLYGLSEEERKVVKWINL